MKISAQRVGLKVDLQLGMPLVPVHSLGIQEIVLPSPRVRGEGS